MARKKAIGRKRATGAKRPRAGEADDGPAWTFLSNHGHVLLCLAANPDFSLREVADAVGITERSVQRIVAELESAGCLVRGRDGRRNTYVIQRGVPLRHPLETHKRVGDLIAMVLGS